MILLRFGSAFTKKSHATDYLDKVGENCSFFILVGYWVVVILNKFYLTNRPQI
jgi:hypothetical protein